MQLRRPHLVPSILYFFLFIVTQQIQRSFSYSLFPNQHNVGFSPDFLLPNSYNVVFPIPCYPINTT